MYNAQTRSQLKTYQQFPTLGNQNEDLKPNADGSYKFCFAPTSRAGREGNWRRIRAG